ncbi:MAG: Arc family DNA-binding protein [Roseiarcus sp.]
MSDEIQHPSDKLDRYIVRFPKGMREQIGVLARANGRSMNAEIIGRLARSLASDISETGNVLPETAVALIPDIHRMVSDLHDALSKPQPARKFTLGGKAKVNMEQAD